MRTISWLLLLLLSALSAYSAVNASAFAVVSPLFIRGIKGDSLLPLLLLFSAISFIICTNQWFKYPLLL